MGSFQHVTEATASFLSGGSRLFAPENMEIGLNLHIFFLSKHKVVDELQVPELLIRSRSFISPSGVVFFLPYID